MPQSITINVPLKILLPYRVLSVIFWAIAILTFLTCLFFVFRNSLSSALMYAALVGVNGITAYGLWKMKKWIVPILGGSAIIVLAMNFMGVLSGTRKASQALLSFSILVVLFLFAYFSRNFLEGEYIERKALVLFLALLIFSQAITFFLK